jgi:integrase/recombinase XerC
MLDDGADLNAIKEILGHSSLTSTQIYTKTSSERLKEIYKQAHPRGD